MRGRTFFGQAIGRTGWYGMFTALSRTVSFRQRNESRRSLKNERDKYRQFLDNVSGVIYCTDPKGTIEYASAGVKTLTGYDAAEVEGKHFSFLVDPRFKEKVFAHYNLQIKNGVLETALEFCAITKDGKIKWVEQTALLLFRKDQPIGFQCFVRDISEKKQMEQDLESFEFRLKENQLLLQSILDNTTSAIYVKGLDGKYLIANKTFMRLFQWDEEHLIGHTDDELCAPADAARYKAMDQQVLRTGRSIEFEEHVNGAEGIIILLVVKFPLKNKDGVILGISGITTDITQRVRYEQQLEAAKTEAENARKMQEQFLANMSHEIRTPMNGIHGMTDLLLETALTPQQKEFTDIIQHSVDNLLVIINDILDLSRIKAGKLVIENIDFRLEDVISNIKALFGDRIRKKSLALDIDIDTATPEWMQGDPHRLNQVLINLLSNAIKFTERGRIVLTIREERRADEKSTLLFTVSDSGIGIPGEHLQEIFQSFTQVGTEISRKHGGTGLGLAICKQLLELQGGSIFVRSQEGKGSEFSFRISYGCRGIKQDRRIASGAGVQNTTLFAGKHFLVVEDNPVNQKLMTFVLRKTGGEVTVAQHGKEAIELLESHKYDLIIMDLQMPVMDGYEATKHLRTRLQVRTPVLALSANAINGEQIRCLEAGMDDYMSKPFEFADFYRRVSKLLDHRGAAPADPKDTPSGVIYDLSLLEEVGDDEYVQDILNTFLSGLPLQLQELREATARRDFEKVFFFAHRLKGSTGMLRAKQLTDKLSKLEELSRNRMDPDPILAEIMQLFEDLVCQLKAA